MFNQTVRSRSLIPVLLGLLLASGAVAAPAAPAAVAFERRAVTALDDYMVDVAAADVNGDRRPDLVTSDSRGRVRVLRNAGGAKLALASTHPIPSGLGQLAVADLDGDGDLDVAVAGEGQQGYPDSTRSSGGAWVLRGDGAGGFGQPVLHPTDRASQSLVAGDLDEDGRMDLVLGNGVAGSAPPGSAVSVLMATAGGGFEPPREPTQLRVSSAVGLADVTGDGHLDLLGGGIEVYPGRGDGTFGDPARTRLDELWAIEAADLDGDGRQDVVAGTYAEKYHVAAMRSQPGGLAAPVELRIGDWSGAATSGGLVVAGFDSRRGPDLAYADYEGVYFLSGDGRGGFGSVVRYPIPGRDRPELAAADLNGDGRLDLARVDTSGNVDLLLNRGEGRRAALSLPRARPFRIAQDRTVHVPLACSRGVGRCVGELTLTAGGRTLGRRPFDLAPRASQSLRLEAPAARLGMRVRVTAGTDAGPRRRDTTVAAPTRAQRRAACSPTGSHTLTRSGSARLFGFGALGIPIGCLYSVGAWTEIPSEYADGPYRTSGDYAAVVGRDLCDPEDCVTLLHVVDLRARRYVTAEAVDALVTGRLVVGPRGAVAWTSCTDNERCERSPDSVVEVYRLDGRGERRVAASRTIDPYSLRVERGGIVWRQGGATRRARFSGTPDPGEACGLDVPQPAGCRRP